MFISTWSIYIREDGVILPPPPAKWAVHTEVCLCHGRATRYKYRIGGCGFKGVLQRLRKWLGNFQFTLNIHKQIWSVLSSDLTERRSAKCFETLRLQFLSWSYSCWIRIRWQIYLRGRKYGEPLIHQESQNFQNLVLLNQWSWSFVLSNIPAILC